MEAVMKTINGEIYKNMIIEAAANLEAHKEEVNSLNVFPVPDGDTGTNMCMTITAAANALNRLGSPSLGKALDTSADAFLRGARGNSGVITSLLFRGITKNMRDLSEADGTSLASALTEGVTTAYKAVMKPAEGTMLTLARVAADAARAAAKKNADAEYVLEAVIAASKPALERTTEQNPVLKKAGVVDAGAYGLLLIFEGMYVALTGKTTGLADMLKLEKPQQEFSGADFSQFETEEITFAYCTEFIADRENMKRSPKKAKAFLESIGDCVVVAEADTFIKVHVHTDRPDKALAEGLKYGRLSAIKIENMQEQHERQVRLAAEAGMKERKVAAPEKRYGFVSVAAGEGICSVFTDLGVDKVVEGGQTMNPSTEDILSAIDQTPAEVIFVLPNNKNIIMASEQAAELSERQVVVIPTKTVPQGLTAMLNFDPECELDVNTAAMNECLENVKTGSVTWAARDSDFDGHNIKENDFMALCEGKLVCSNADFADTAKKLAKTICDKKTAFVTLIYGQDATEEQIAMLNELLTAEAPNAEVNVIDGGQPVYSFIVSAE